MSPLVMAEAVASRARVRARIEEVAARIAGVESAARIEEQREGTGEADRAEGDYVFTRFAEDPRRS